MINSSLTNDKISNYGEMEYRRLLHKLGVVYETPLSKMKEIPNFIKSIIDSCNSAIFDRLRLGIGRPDYGNEVDYVLGKPESEDVSEINSACISFS